MNMIAMHKQIERKRIADNVRAAAGRYVFGRERRATFDGPAMSPGLPGVPMREQYLAKKRRQAERRAA